MQSTLEQVRILVVDDDIDVVRLLQAALNSNLKNEVVLRTADDAVGAMDILDQTPMDLVITDLDMDDVNGFHLLKRIKSNAPFLQVIIMTAHASPNALCSAAELGADDYLVKPFITEQLMQSVRFLRDKLRRWRAAGLVE